MVTIQPVKLQSGFHSSLKMCPKDFLSFVLLGMTQNILMNKF